MPFYIRLLIALVILILLEIHFIKRLKWSVRNTLQPVNENYLKNFSRLFFVLVNLFPLYGISLGIYLLIKKPVNFIPPENLLLDYLVIYPFWFLAIIVIQSLLFILPLDLIRLVLAKILKKKDAVQRRFAIIFFAVFVLSFVYAPSRIIYDLNSIKVSEVEYFKEDLEEELKDFKIVLISDVQADRYTNRVRLSRYIDKVNSLNPDLVLISGDIITGSPKYINFAAEFLGNIKSKNGIYSCVGDHDNWAYRSNYERSVSEIRKALENNNIQMIDNEIRNIEANGLLIQISFVTNTYVERIDENQLDTLTAIDNNKLSIFLTHQPRQYLIDKAIEKQYDLFLCGHTHGGQITFLFPFFNPSVTHIETFYVQGQFWFDNMLMYVNSGLGMSLAPVRYNSTPEITIIKLAKQK